METKMFVWISSLHHTFRKIPSTINQQMHLSSTINQQMHLSSTINQQMHLYNFHLKHLKPLRRVSIFSDHHQGISSFLAKVITYSRFSSFL